MYPITLRASHVNLAQLLDQVRQALDPANETDRRESFPTNLHQTETGFELQAILPGIAREKIRLNIQDQTLTIEADAEAVTDESQWQFEARPVNRSRTFRLGRQVDTSAISASHRDGVLTVTLPKRAEAAARAIDIQ